MCIRDSCTSSDNVGAGGIILGKRRYTSNGEHPLLSLDCSNNIYGEFSFGYDGGGGGGGRGGLAGSTSGFGQSGCPNTGGGGGGSTDTFIGSSGGLTTDLQFTGGGSGIIIVRYQVQEAA